MNQFELKDLVFRRSARFILEIARFSLESGEKVAVVGANGSGKTTFLRILSFLEQPDSWDTFLYRDQPCGRTTMDRRGLGFLKQQPYLFGGSVTQNLTYPLKVCRLPDTEIRSRLDAMLERMELVHLAEASACDLSGGEQKRLALGRTLIADRETLLLDEPTAHLDARSRAVIEDALRKSNQTILLTTHDLHFAHRVADRVLALKVGRLSARLPVNLLEGQVEDGRLVTGRGLRLSLPEGTVPTRYGSLTVMIDPRSIDVSVEQSAMGSKSLMRGRISSIQEHGDDIWLEIDCGDRLTAIISRTTYTTEGLNLQSEVVVTFDSSAVEVL
ncbi:MAG: ABC transporter ATP-binding protein [bacterium]|nr:ABC transporter ATP-binding protein [bacterium]